jgi:hypothetical protein
VAVFGAAHDSEPGSGGMIRRVLAVLLVLVLALGFAVWCAVQLAAAYDAPRWP